MNLIDFWNLLKESWKDPRRKAIIKLSFYIIFFAGVILMIKGNNKPSYNIKNPAKSYDNYCFTYTLNNNIIVEGTYDQSIVKYELENQIYYIYDDIYYKLVNDTLVTNDRIGLKIDKFLLDKIDIYQSNSDKLYKTEFKDGSIKKGYQILVENFALIYDNKEISDQNYINFNVTFVDNQIKEVEFNLTPYFKSYYNINDDYNLMVSFSEFNSADKLELNFSK